MRRTQCEDEDEDEDEGGGAWSKTIAQHSAYCYEPRDPTLGYKTIGSCSILIVRGARRRSYVIFTLTGFKTYWIIQFCGSWIVYSIHSGKNVYAHTVHRFPVVCDDRRLVFFMHASAWQLIPVNLCLSIVTTMQCIMPDTIHDCDLYMPLLQPLTRSQLLHRTFGCSHNIDCHIFPLLRSITSANRSIARCWWSLIDRPHPQIDHNNRKSDCQLTVDGWSTPSADSWDLGNRREVPIKPVLDTAVRKSICLNRMPYDAINKRSMHE